MIQVSFEMKVSVQQGSVFLPFLLISTVLWWMLSLNRPESVN